MKQSEKKLRKEKIKIRTRLFEFLVPTRLYHNFFKIHPPSFVSSDAL